ncbi:MAG: septal ring lytic transglycosylase RlpA family protein [Ginsengibacter sp.]
MKNLLLLFLCAGLFLGSSKALEKDKSAQGTAGTQSKLRYGIASYYAKKFSGRLTATGSVYDPNKYTAACNVLPLRTWIRVTNLRNNKSVIVKVTDRLHRNNKRLVDLSFVAAKELGYVSRGLTKVQVEVLRNYSPPK